MIFGKKKAHKEFNIWASISDLMSGLMIIFLFISIAFMSKVSKENEEIKKQQSITREIVDKYKGIRGAIYKDLYDEFRDDMNVWNIEIDKENLAVRFLEPEVFFDLGKSNLKPQFKAILDDFFPRYIGIIYGKYRENVDELRIEGYTSSEWSSKTSLTDSYFKNMELSQDRTRIVLEYIMGLEVDNSNYDWLIEHITANGMSFSHRYYKDEKNEEEDREKSRRVEFSIRTNAEAIISEIVEEFVETEEIKNEID